MRLVPARQQTPSSSMTMTPVITRAGIGRIAALVVGDAVSFLVFGAIGRLSHHETIGLGQVVGTALPFALGWFVVAPLAGAYRRRATATPGAMLRRTGLAWLVAWPVTLVLRWVFTGAAPQVSFAIVILLSNSVLLGMWRGLFALVTSRLSAPALPTAPAVPTAPIPESPAR